MIVYFMKGCKMCKKYDDLSDTKEISDIESEINKTKELLEKQQWDELDKHLSKLQIKYFFETAIYNIFNPIMPRNTKENAINCNKFLQELLQEKLIDKATEKLK